MIASRSSPWTRSRFLTKNGSAAVSAKNSCSSGRLAQRLAQRVVDARRRALMPIAITPRRLARAAAGRAARTSSTTRSTSAVTLLRAGVSGSNGDAGRADAAGAGRAREGDQRAVVDVGVGEGDEPLVPAAVVPAQHAYAGSSARQHVEDRLVAGGQRQVDRAVGPDAGGSSPSPSSAAVEERRRRQLVLVAGDDELLARAGSPGRRRPGVTWLASSKMTTSKQVARRAAAGDTTSGLIAQHGLQRGQHVGAVGEELADRQVPALRGCAWCSIRRLCVRDTRRGVGTMCSATARSTRLAVASMCARSAARNSSTARGVQRPVERADPGVGEARGARRIEA